MCRAVQWVTIVIKYQVIDSDIDNRLIDNERHSVDEQLVMIQSKTLETDNGNSIIAFEDLVTSGAYKDINSNLANVNQLNIVL